MRALVQQSTLLAFVSKLHDQSILWLKHLDCLYGVCEGGLGPITGLLIVASGIRGKKGKSGFYWVTVALPGTVAPGSWAALKPTTKVNFSF